jgi:hypothetical protein
MCAISCVNNEICDAGECTCPPDLTECSDVCVDTETDKSHCGECGEVCPSNQICTGGECGCPPELTLCGVECVDLDSDPDHCGGCDDACPTGEFCTARECLAAPCDGICSSPTNVPLRSDGFRIEPLGTAAGCYEVRNYNPMQTNPRIVCWEFQDGRTLRVNGQTTPCVANGGTPLPGIRADGYCVQVGAGGAEFAGILFPTR